MGGEDAGTPQSPKQVTPLFNGKDLSGLTTWLQDTKTADPRKVFRVEDGVIRISGDGNGYVATEKEYRDYHLVVEYKWGKRTDGGKYVRNSGILLHATGPDGGAGGTWMSSIECQLAQGCVGDLIPIRGKDAAGKVIPVQFTSDVVLGPDNRPRWKPGGTARVFTARPALVVAARPGLQGAARHPRQGRRREPAGRMDTRRVPLRGDTITVQVNGTTVNECRDAVPSAGKILLQSEGFELLVRKFELHPLTT